MTSTPPHDAPDPAKLTPVDTRFSSWILRGGLLGAALASWNSATMLWEGGSCTNSFLSTALMLLGYVAGFALLVSAVIERPHHRTRFLVLLTLLLVFFSYAQNHRIAQAENGLLTTDVRLYMDQAARCLRHGQNPYTADLLDAYRFNHAPLNFSTPLLDGDLTGRVAYPALSILVFLPFQWIGVPPDWVYPTFLLITLVFLFFGAPRHLQPLILLPLFIDPRYVLYSLGGVSDIVWALLLVVMVHTWRRPRLRAIWYGLAAAFKHQPWVLAPFLIIRIWHETSVQTTRERRKAIGVFIAWSVLTFSVINLPFLLWSPLSWLRAVFEPVVAPMITFGQGLSALTMFGYVVIPKIFFSLFMTSVLGVSLYVYHRHFSHLRHLLWIAPGLMLWLSNRSLTSYWYFYLIPLLYDLVSHPPLVRSSEDPEPSRRSAWRTTIVSISVIALGILGLVSFLAFMPSQPRMRIVPPLITEGNHVVHLKVSLENNTHSTIKPRFAVQTIGLQPFFWHIDSGPLKLARGQRAIYTISSDAPFSSFDVRHGARLTVSHAGSQAIRSTVRIRPDRTPVYPDVIPNPNYHFWSKHSHAPTFWGLVRDPSNAGTVRYITPTDKNAPSSALRFSLRSGSSSERSGSSSESLFLDTYLDLPQQDIELTVRRPVKANMLPDLRLLYGLRVIVDETQTLILFGDRHSKGKLGPRLRYVMLPAPVEKWSKQRLSLPNLLRQVGVDSIPSRHRLSRFGHLDFPVVPANLQLFFARRTGHDKATCLFGPLHTLGRRLDPEFQYRAAQRHPAALALWRGQFNFSQRNFAKAETWLDRAGKLEPHSPRIQLEIGETKFWLGHYRASLDAFAKARRNLATAAFAYKGIGWSHYILGQYEEALMAWHDAERHFELRHRPDERVHRADVYKGMTLALLRLGRCERAAERLQMARALNPKISVPTKLLGLCRKQSPTSRP